MKESTAWAILGAFFGVFLTVAIVGDNIYAVARDKVDAEVTIARNQNVTEMVTAGADPIDAACSVDAPKDPDVCLVRAASR